LEIISPEFSFLNFGLKEYPECYDIEPVPLPKCGDLAIKAQIELLTDELIPVTTPFYVAIGDTACNVIEDEDVNITPICSTYKFRTYYTEEPELPDLGDDNIYNLCYDEGAPIETITFDTNPFDEITSTILDFVITLPVILSGVQLYIGDKAYIMEYDSTFVASSYSFTQVGDTYFVKLKVGTVIGDSYGNMLHFLNDIVDVNHGITSATYLSAGVNHIEIFFVPAGSYFNTHGAASSVTGTTPTTNLSRFFYYTGSGVAYKNLYYTLTASPYYEFQDALSATDIVRYAIEYNATYNDFEFEITIDDGINPVTTIPATISAYTGNIEFTYVALNTSAHEIRLTITDNKNHRDGFEILSIKKYTSTVFNVVSSMSGYGYVEIPVGTYSRQQLKALISAGLGFEFDCQFTTCCDVPKISFETQPVEETTLTYELTEYWNKGFIDYPDNPITDTCFTYVILDSEKEVIACSNEFTSNVDCCFISTIEYGNNEDAFGFSYPAGVTNMIQLPFYPNQPQYKTKEDIYRTTGGRYRRLNADIEKEWTCETDYMTTDIHDRLITALKHDYVRVVSERFDIDDEVVQEGDYEVDWNEPTDFDAKAEFKIKKYFNGKNTNCGSGCG
jgi:hypothetical protein